MTLPLTKEMLEQCYDFLRSTPPFKSWNMPEAEDVNFRVVKDPCRRGYYQFGHRSDEHYIAVSSLAVGHTSSLIETMAHEMVHLHERVLRAGNGAAHTTFFRRMAERVCKYHGFDPKLFY